MKPYRQISALALCVLLLLLVACSPVAEVVPTPTPTVTPTAAPTTEPMPTAEGMPTPAATPTAEPMPIPTPVPTFSPQDAYRLEKLNEVCDMALNRQVIPQDYCRYLDETVATAVEQYNTCLGNARATTISYAKKEADIFRNTKPSEDPAYASYGKYLEEGDNYYRFIDEFSRALLFPNHWYFTQYGTVVGFPAAAEAGGSGGLWLSGFYLQKDSIEELAAAVETLLDEADAARIAFGH